MADQGLPCASSRVKTEHSENMEAAAWAEYVALQRAALQTFDMQDGIAAGKAWGRWLKLFERPAPQYEADTGSNIIRLGARP